MVDTEHGASVRPGFSHEDESVLLALQARDRAGKPPFAQLKELLGHVHDSEEFWKELGKAVRALFVQFHSLPIETSSGPADEFLKELQRLFFHMEQLAPKDYASLPLFYLGEVAALTELVELKRVNSLPIKAASVLSRHKKNAMHIMRLVNEQRNISPTEVARLMGRTQPQPLIPLINELAEVGLIRRHKFGKSVVLSPTSLSRMALQQWQRESPAQSLDIEVPERLPDVHLTGSETFERASKTHASSFQTASMPLPTRPNLSMRVAQVKRASSVDIPPAKYSWNQGSLQPDLVQMVL